MGLRTLGIAALVGLFLGLVLLPPGWAQLGMGALVAAAVLLTAAVGCLMLVLLGQPPSARRLRDRLARLECRRGPADPEVLSARRELARVYVQQGRVGSAVPLMEHAVHDSLYALGPNRPETLDARRELGSAYLLLHRPDHAVPLLEEAMAELERVAGPDDPVTLLTRAELADAYACAGRRGEARVCYEFAIGELTRVLGPGHPETRRLLGQYGDQCRDWRLLGTSSFGAEAA
ncbi:tetratricopeptide repeat protein [Allonocardiopsis opalescens]|uniref:Tetratricopeptide repeat protein n=1 Tax=Allonocardiopsis opalescens TaxID=1144618 RepID=A0A2T0QAM9_9ACTN|nr:tetratricopeptide repeat protein [Allonocardiopsis opalescens]PRY00914.1 tetratricopeptide repeat protein [Allonocardiopsis opalescens]